MSTLEKENNELKKHVTIPYLPPLKDIAKNKIPKHVKNID